uniref:Gustatory receptor n=1 Tax=Lutzomyia longipalpis TaxID=7200 RepID=A0A3F2ZD97_LUTLO
MFNWKYIRSEILVQKYFKFFQIKYLFTKNKQSENFAITLIIIRYILIIFAGLNGVYDIFYIFTEIENYAGDESLVSRFAVGFEVSSIHFCVIILGWFSIVCGRKHANYIEKSIIFSKELEEVVDIQKTTKYKISIFYKFLVLINDSLCNFSFYYYRYGNALNYFSNRYMRNFVAVCLIDLMHCYMIELIDFQKNCMEELYVKLKNSSCESYFSIIQLTDRSIKIVKSFNRIFSLLLSSNLHHHFFEISISTYFLIRRYFVTTQEGDISLKNIFDMMWIQRSIFLSFHLCLKGHNFMHQAEQLICAVNDINIYHHEAEEIPEIFRSYHCSAQQFSMRSLHEKIKIMTEDFHRIDRTLIKRICASTATFILILIQFKQLEDRN